jgi:hypothetical protein
MINDNGDQCFTDFFLVDPFWILKLTKDPHIAAQVNTECPDDRYAELKMYLS